MINKLISITFIIVIFVSNAVLSRTFIIDKNNKYSDDSNPGTFSLPLKTIQSGINLAQAGDTILVMPGIYTEALRIKRSGNKDAGDIVIKSSKKYGAVIDGTNIQKNKLIYWHGKSDGGKNKDYIVFDGFDVVNAKKWAFWIQGDYNIFKNLKVHETGSSAIQLITGSHNQFINNEIFNTGWNGISWESNNGECGIRTDSNLVMGNYFHDLKYHVAVNGFPNESTEKPYKYGGKGNRILKNIIRQCLEGIYLRYEKDFLIEGNLIENINKDAIFFHYYNNDKAPYVANGKIINNTIAKIGYNGISNSNAKNLDIINNIFYDNGDSLKTQPYYSYCIYWYPITASENNNMNANLYYNDNGNKNLVYLYDGNKNFSELNMLGFEKEGKQANPMFVNPKNGNYSLNKNSPAIDAGIRLTGDDGKVDINSVRRSQGGKIDLGAYEYIQNKRGFIFKD